MCHYQADHFGWSFRERRRGQGSDPGPGFELSRPMAAILPGRDPCGLQTCSILVAELVSAL